MEFTQWASFAVGVLAAIAAAGMAVALIVVPRFRTRNAAFVLSVSCIFGGVLVASFATPDWSPVAMLGFYSVFLAVGLFAAGVSAHRTRQSRKAARRV